MKTSRTLARIETHDLKVRRRELDFGSEAIAAVPVDTVRVAVLVDAHLQARGRLFGYGCADEAEACGADAAGDWGCGVVWKGKGEGEGGAVAAVADVEHVFGAGGEGDYVDDVDPEERKEETVSICDCWIQSYSTHVPRTLRTE